MCLPMTTSRHTFWKTPTRLCNEIAYPTRRLTNVNKHTTTLQWKLTHIDVVYNCYLCLYNIEYNGFVDWSIFLLRYQHNFMKLGSDIGSDLLSCANKYINEKKKCEWIS